MTFIVTRKFAVTDPKTHKRLEFDLGQILTKAQERKIGERRLRDYCAQAARKYTRRATVTNEARITDEAVLHQFLSIREAGLVVEGGYREVWEQLAEVLDGPGYNHFRALQIARVGREFERITRDRFETICPDLRAVASDWTSCLG